MPGRVAGRIVGQGEPLLTAVFLVNVFGNDRIHRGPFGDDHLVDQVRAGLVRPEIEQRQMPVRQVADEERNGQRQDQRPDRGPAAEHPVQRRTVEPQQEREQEQHHILFEGLPVAQHNGVAEAAAVAHRIAQGDIEREQGHGQHIDSRHGRDDPLPGAQQQGEAQHHLKRDEGHGEKQGVFIEDTPAEGLQVILDLVSGSQGIDCLDKARKDKSCSQQYPGNPRHGFVERLHFRRQEFFRRKSCESARKWHNSSYPDSWRLSPLKSGCCRRATRLP